MKSNNQYRKKVGIVGGGAAGMAAAITAAGNGAEVTILERNDRLGKKILATGNGKCNLGNRVLSEKEYYGKNIEFIKNTLQRFGTEETMDFFQKMGLLIKEKNGYLYPVSEQAAVVLDVLRYELQALGVKTVTEFLADQIQKEGKSGKIRVGNGKENYSFDAVILACGSKAAPKTGSDGSGYQLAKKLGHTLVSTVPALVQLKCREDYFKAVAGVRTEAALRVYVEENGSKQTCIAQEKGELQLTEYGISGIPVFQLSRVVNYILQERKTVWVEIDLFPDYDRTTFRKLMEEREKSLGRGRTVEEFFTGLLNKKLMLLFIKMAGLKAVTPIEKADKRAMEQVYSYCKCWKVQVTGSNSYENAQVCAGGISTDELTENMESVKVPGVYIVGELMDVDGKCGGYNLHWAWASGCIAGEHAARY